LIALAQENYPDANWQVQDMIDALSSMATESADCLIAIASFQHLQNIELREQYLTECYRVLRYGGKLIMTNWSFSHWFLRRFWKQVLSSTRKSFIEPTWASNDIMVPWKKQDKSEIFYRYYHIFRLAELERLTTQAGFVIDTSGYVITSGNLVTRWKDARNTLLISTKQIFLNS
jgi:ubiquinone/menaquinone biosynthesis C-methylase UbiE